MTYQVVASHRTGSSLLNDYALNHHDRFGFNEIFLNKTNSELIKELTTEERFQFLQYYKKQDIHFTTKIFPYKIISEGYEEHLFEYLEGYKILTIDRNPWDAFLSHSYQDACNWKSSHRFPDVNFIELNSFHIRTYKIKHFCNKWKTDFNFIKRLDVHHTFLYEDLTTNKLKKYFNTTYETPTGPNNLNYKKLATNYTEAKELFDYEMQSTRNRPYD